MILTSNPEKAIQYCDESLDKMCSELREFAKMFGKRKRIYNAIKAINELKKTYPQWERIDISPYSGKSLQVEAEEQRRIYEQHESNIQV